MGTYSKEGRGAEVETHSHVHVGMVAGADDPPSKGDGTGGLGRSSHNPPTVQGLSGGQQATRGVGGELDTDATAPPFAHDSWLWAWRVRFEPPLTPFTSPALCTLPLH